MEKLVRGVLDFQQHVFPEKEDLFGELATGQSPEVLFITCSDSRIDPNLLTGTIPGDLFICRNAGNIIPPHNIATGGMTASIEYAVAVLGVQHIIICGHTDCGAIKGALNLASVKGLPHVREWLGHCRSAMEIVRERNEISPDEILGIEYLNEAIEQNVIQQLQHICTHPSVAVKLAMGKLQLHGWVYNIRNGSVRCCDHRDMSFRSFNEQYADIIESMK